MILWSFFIPPPLYISIIERRPIFTSTTPKKGGVIEKIHSLSFDLRIFRHYDRRIIIRTYYPIPQSTDSNQRKEKGDALNILT